ncbi:Uma2 family endonuclease [Pseudanabaenaceae cyanobacterium LEGE 13415]|nr:Uma2 family endonuclease [Pseudanabaenaceae cyanobacterium LEGE 13415]
MIVSQSTSSSKHFTFEDFVARPDYVEWIDGRLIEKTGTTMRHGIVRGHLMMQWDTYADSYDAGGRALPSVPCRLLNRGKRPDVSYLPPDILTQSIQLNFVPQSPPLLAEVVSPIDCAEELFSKAIEYLESGCQEIWLIFPEAKLIMVKTIEQPWQVFSSGQTIATRKVLVGFSIAIDQLFA